MGWAAVSAVTGVASLISGLSGASKAARAAKKAARLERQMTGVQVKRLEYDQARDLSKVDVLQSAGGFHQTSNTQTTYRDEFQRLQREEVDWLKLVGASRYNQQMAQADMYKSTGIANALGGIASLAGSKTTVSGMKNLFGIT